MLLVTIGYRRKGGVSKTRVGEILGLEASSYLDDLLREGLIYCDPSREVHFWRPTPEALLALGYGLWRTFPRSKSSKSGSIPRKKRELQQNWLLSLRRSINSLPGALSEKSSAEKPSRG